MEQWIVEHWFDLFSTIGIVGSLWIAIVTFRSDAKTRRVANFLTVAGNHQAVWKEFLNKPGLARVFDETVNVANEPVTPAERMFVSMVIVHASSVFQALKDDLLINQEGLRQDIAQFFSLPVPNAVWQRAKLLQNHDFSAFIDSILKQP